MPPQGPRVFVYRLLPSGRRHLCFLAPTRDLAWVYWIQNRRRRQDGRTWVEHEFAYATLPDIPARLRDYRARHPGGLTTP